MLVCTGANPHACQRDGLSGSWAVGPRHEKTPTARAMGVEGLHRCKLRRVSALSDRQKKTPEPCGLGG